MTGDTVRSRFEKQLRTRRGINAVVAGRGCRRFLHPCGFAALIRDASGTPTLLSDGWYQAACLQRDCVVLARHKLSRFVGVVGFQNLVQRSVLAAREIEWQQPVALNTADTDLTVGETEFGEFH